MAEVANLKGRKIVVTRPEPQASRLCRQIHSLGGISYNCPMLEIAPLPLGQLPDWNRYDWLIFISANAVKFALRAGLGPAVTAQLAAIGQATAAALQKPGLKVACQAPSPYTSESLLAEPRMQTIRGQRVLIAKGQGGRQVLEEALIARGAEVEATDLYRRLPPQPESVERFQAALQAGVDGVIVTSGEILRHLVAAAGRPGGGMLSVPLVVVSQRLAELARQAGFRQVITAASASNEALLEALQRLPAGVCDY